MSVRLLARVRFSALVLISLSVLPAQPLPPSKEASVDDGPPSVTFGTTTYLPSGLRGAVYAIPENTTFLPDFDKLKPLGYLYTNRLNIPTRQFSAGFPGISGQAEWFAIDYRGRFWIRNPGKYTFALTSDDGARLYIDNKLLIDNDGQHPTKTVTSAINLTPRLHSIRVTYFQGPKYELALILAVSPPKGKWRVFNMTDYVPAGDEITEAEAETMSREDRDYLQRQQLQEASSRDEKAAIKVLAEKPLPHDFEFRTAVFSFRVDEAGSQNVLAFELPSSSVKATADLTSATQKIDFFVFVAVKDLEGRILKKFTLDKPYRIPDAQFAAVRSSGFTFARPLPLPRGAFTLETVVFDREAKTVSASSVPIDRLALVGRLGMSTPVLVQKVQVAQGQTDPGDFLVVEGKRLVPQLAPEIDRDTKPQVYFVVYPDKQNQALPTVTIAFFSRGKELAKQTSGLPPPDATGAIPITIAAEAQPGECELRITVAQGSDSVSRSVRYSVPAASR
jgi:PA14 domain